MNNQAVFCRKHLAAAAAISALFACGCASTYQQRSVKGSGVVSDLLMHLTKVSPLWIIDTWDGQNFLRRCVSSDSNSLPTPSAWSISHKADGRAGLCARSVAAGSIG